MIKMRRQTIIILVIVLLVVFGLGVVAGTGLYFLFRLGSAPARTFITTLSDVGIESAYQLTAADFQRQATLEQFTDFVTTSGLDTIQGSRWRSVKLNYDSPNNSSDNSNTINGSLKLANGTRLPVTLTFVQEQEQWRVVKIILDNGALEFPSQLLPTLPTQAEATVLAETTWQTMASYIVNNDYDGFYEWVTPQFRQSYSRADFESAISDNLTPTMGQAILDANVTLDQEQKYNPDSQVYSLYGSLQLVTDNKQVYFRLSFSDETGEWKLYSFELKEQP